MYIQLIIDEAVNGWMLTIIPKSGQIHKEVFVRYLEVLQAITKWSLKESTSEKQKMVKDSMEVI